MYLPLSKYFFIGATPAIKTFNCLLALLFSSKEASFSLLSDLELTWTASRVFDTANPYLYLSLNILLWVFIGAFQGFFPWLLFAQTCSSDASVSITIVFFSFFRCCSFPFTILPIALLGCRRFFLFSFFASLSSIKCRLLISIDLAGSCPYFLYRWLYLCVYFSYDNWPLLKCVQYCCGST